MESGKWRYGCLFPPSLRKRLICFVDCFEGSRLFTLREHLECINCLRVCCDKFASGSVDTRVCVWNWKTGALLNVLEEHQGEIFCVTFVNDNLLITGGGDDLIKVWTLVGSRCILTLHSQPEVVGCLQFDRNCLISGQGWLPMLLSFF